MVTVNGLDIHQCSEGILGLDDCSAVITRSDFVGNGYGVRLFQPSVDVDLGTKLVSVVGGDDSAIRGAIDDAGYDIA